MRLFLAETSIGLSVTALLLLPQAVGAECISGPEVVVNLGHGASITFDEPVYQAQVFDVSKLMLEPIPEQGTTTLILTEVDPQNFPGLPQTATTSILASTANSCYVFEVSFGNQAHHNSVSAVPPANTDLTAAQLPGGDDIDIEALRSGHANALAQHGGDNLFLQRVSRFIELVDAGTTQRLAARQAQVDWSHLQQLSGQPNLDQLVDDSFGA